MDLDDESMNLSDEDLETITSTIRDWEFKDGFIQLMEFVRSNWGLSGWGWFERTDEEGVRCYSVSTGGWSDNEMIIGALESNIIFWTFCWYSSKRGGHYEFKVKS